MIAKWWNQFRQQEFVEVTFLNAMGIVIRLITALASAKLFALFLGASGMALMGNLRNALASLEAFSTFGFNNGIVQYIASHRGNQLLIEKFINRLLSFMLLVLVVVGVLLIGFHSTINHYLFGSSYSLPWLFIVLAFTFPLQVLNGVFVAFLTGIEQFKKVIYLNVIGNISGLCLTIYLVCFYKLQGALLGIVISPALLFFVSLFWIRKSINLRWEFDYLTTIKPLFSYSLMALYSAIVSPLIFLWIRQLIIQNNGLDEAGYWEGIQRISGIYMLFITTLVFTYFLPKLSIAKQDDMRQFWMRKYCYTILPCFGIALILLYVIKDFVIYMVLDKSFLPMTDFMLGQLIGDFFKAFALIYGLLFYTQRLVIAYIFFETLFFALFYGLSYLSIPQYGAKGATLSYSFSYIVYAVVLVVYFSWYFSPNKKRKL